MEEIHLKQGLKQCGRPSGRMKTAKIEIAIEPDIKKEFMELLRANGKQASVEIGTWIREYIKQENIKQQSYSEAHTLIGSEVHK